MPPPNGGMAMQTLQLRRLLSEEGVAVETVQTNSPCSPSFMERVKGVRALFRLLPYLWRVWHLCGRVDVIHLMANSGWSWQLYAAPVLWAAWFRGTPVIVNYRGGEARDYMVASSRWVKPSLKKADVLVVPSGFLKQVFSDFDVSSVVIPNIIDLGVFNPGLSRQSAEKFTVAVTRNLEPIYGLDTAIRSIALAREKVPHIQLKIAGSGPQRPELEQLVADLGLGDTVVFLGRLERASVVELYQASDVMLNSSTVDNMPNSVLEAMACGVPVVSTNVGGVPYMVRDGETAVMIAPSDETAMANAIVDLAVDSSKRETLAKNGREEVLQYDWQRVKTQWLDLYQRLAGRG